MAGEVKLTIDEVVRMVMEAKALQDLDRNVHGGMEKMIERLSPTSSTLGLEYCRQAAEEIGVERKYIERVVAAHYPPLEQQVRDVKTLGAVPSRDIILGIYEENIEQRLGEIYPSKDFYLEREGYGSLTIFEIQKNVEIVRGIFGTKTKERVTHRKWAYMRLYEGNLTNGKRGVGLLQGLIIYTPLFTQACGETIKELMEKFGKLSNCNIEYDYKIE